MIIRAGSPKVLEYRNMRCVISTRRCSFWTFKEFMLVPKSYLQYAVFDRLPAEDARYVDLDVSFLYFTMISNVTSLSQIS